MIVTIDAGGMHYRLLTKEETEELMRKLWEAVKAHEKERE